MMDVTLTEHQARAILRQAGIDGPVTVTPLKRHNHVWRLDQNDATFYLKTHTKPWYPSDASVAAYPVAHECAAAAYLATHGVAMPEVILAQRDTDNPLGRPFMLTRALQGMPLTAYVSEPDTLCQCLEVVGRYLRRVHALTFVYPGYIMDDGPAAPPHPDLWQHRCWTARRRQQEAQAMLQNVAEGGQSTVLVHTTMEALFETMEERLAAEYEPPHFVHGDCHAHQFFVEHAAGRWQVTGMVDLEVASSGDCGEDLLKFCLELAPLMPPATRWWESFFGGYGRVPDFELFRLRLLGISGVEYEVTGWPGTHTDVLAHVLNARSWDDLFTLHKP